MKNNDYDMAERKEPSQFLKRIHTIQMLQREQTEILLNIHDKLERLQKYDLDAVEPLKQEIKASSDSVSVFDELGNACVDSEKITEVSRRLLTHLSSIV